MTKYTVRPATPYDIPFILAVHKLPHVHALLTSPTTEQVKSAFTSPKSGFEQFIVCSAGEAVGLVLLEAVAPWLFEIRRIISAQEGCGIGTYALRTVLKQIFEERSAHRAYLEVLARNTRARRLYEMHRFVLEGTWRDGACNPVSGEFEDLCAYGILIDEYRGQPDHG